MEPVVLTLFLASSALLSSIQDFMVHDFDSLLSDTHCPISCSLSSIQNISGTQDSERLSCHANSHENSSDFNDFSFKWDSTSHNAYCNAISNADITGLLELVARVEVEPSQDSVNELCSNFSELIDKAKECGVCKERVFSSNSNNAKNKKQQPWFDSECKKARSDYYKVKNKLKFIDSSERQTKIQKASKHFKNMIKLKKNQYFDRAFARICAGRCKACVSRRTFLRKIYTSRFKYMKSIQGPGV